MNNGQAELPGRAKAFRMGAEFEWEEYSAGFVRCRQSETTGGKLLCIYEEAEHDEKQEPLVEIEMLEQYKCKKSRENAILWYQPNPETGHIVDHALSFAEQDHCDKIWNELGIQEHVDPEDDVVFQGTEESLPPVSYGNLNEILVELDNQLHGRRLANLEALKINCGAYMKRLLEVFDECEDMEDIENLHILFNIFKRIIELNDVAVLRLLLSDEFFLPLTGVLEYNPALLKRGNFRASLEQEMKFKEVVPIPDASISAKIHLNFRIEAIKDNILARVLNDSTVSLLNGMANENNCHILGALTRDSVYAQGILRAIESPDSRSDGLSLLRDMIRLVKRTLSLRAIRPDPSSEPVFSVFYRSISNTGELFSAFAKIIGQSSNKSSSTDVNNRTIIMETLSTLLSYQHGELVRRFMLSEAFPEAPTENGQKIKWNVKSSLMTAILYSFESHDDNRAQVYDVLRSLLTEPIVGDDRFMNMFYDHYMIWLLQPLQRQYGRGDSLYALQNSVCELLTYCLVSHGYRMRYVIQRQPVFSSILQLLSVKDKFLSLLAIKFVRACIGLKQGFYSRYIVNNKILSPVFKVLEENLECDNVINSAILELVHFIQNENLEILVEHIYKQYYEKFKDVSYGPLFDIIKQRYEQNERVHAVEEQMFSTDSTSSATTPRTFHNDLGDDDEAYFDSEDDALTPPRGPVAADTPRDFVPLKLVDYEDDEEIGPQPLPEQKEQNDGQLKEPNLHPLKPNQEEEEAGFFTIKKGRADTPMKSSGPLKNKFSKISWKMKESNPSPGFKRKRTQDHDDNDNGNMNVVDETTGSPAKKGKLVDLNDDVSKISSSCIANAILSANSMSSCKSKLFQDSGLSLQSTSDELSAKVNQLACTSDSQESVDSLSDDGNQVETEEIEENGNSTTSMNDLQSKCTNKLSTEQCTNKRLTVQE